MTLDLIIMAMPMPTLYKLHINWRKKLQIMVMFSVGIIIILVCIFRLRIFVRELDTDNPTYDLWALLVWDAAEAFTSIVCVCLPAAKCFFQRSFTWSIAALRERCPKEVLHFRRRPRRRLPDLPVSERRNEKEIVKETSTSLSPLQNGTASLPDWATSFTGTGTDTRCSRTSTPVIPTDGVPKAAQHPSPRICTDANPCDETGRQR